MACSKGAQEEDARQIFWQLIPALDYCHKMVRCWDSFGVLFTLL